MLVRGSMVLVVVLSVGGPAFGQLGALIYSQAPNRLGGFYSDTAYTNELGQLDGSIFADRFLLNQSSVVSPLRWWGIYGPQSGPIQIAPAHEEFRIRFYDQQGTFPPNLPPATVLYETTISNPLREETGFLVSGGFPEYRFTVSLAKPFVAETGVPYWIEISQQRDVSSLFRWEKANFGEYAVQYPLGTPWRTNQTGEQLAYELRVPEPGSAVLVGLVGLMLRRRGECA